ncbi:MAG TPA: hypothetical protein PLX08_00935 [Bacteroidales bacterium]|nr:hypothetical protein [Bacteroidales bacterium]
MKKITTLITGLFLSMMSVVAQTVFSPNYSLKSHETLVIQKIELKSDETVFYMGVENRITGGSFCADKNIYILYPDGKKSRLVSSSGIPVCPESYKFSAPGEKLEFVLTFPPLKAGTRWVDLIEDCKDNCFSFYGILLDNALNERINNAFTMADTKEYSKALNAFTTVLESINEAHSGIEGLLYINIIKLAIETGDDRKAEEWYGKFRVSGAPRLSVYLKYLNDQGIRY